MKKHEAPPLGRTGMKSLLIFALVVGGPALAQEQAPPTAPPLVPADSVIPGTEPAPVMAAPLVPKTIANAPLVETPPNLLGRMALELTGGLVLGAALAVGGGLVGPSLLKGDAVQPIGSRWTAASVGFALGAPLGVLITGALLKVKGSVVATVLASLAGAAVGALAVWLAGTDGTPLLFALPLAGSVIGWEFSAL